MVEITETKVFVALKNMQSKSSREELKMSLWKNNENSRKIKCFLEVRGARGY